MQPDPFAEADVADAVEQQIPATYSEEESDVDELNESDESGEPEALPLEASEADVVEQHAVIPTPDEYEY